MVTPTRSLVHLLNSLLMVPVTIILRFPLVVLIVWLTSLFFSLSRVGEGNGNPLQCSCLENLRDGGAWWVSVYGVTQSRT